MKVKIHSNRNEQLVVSVVGRLDTTTAPKFQSQMDALGSPRLLMFDFAELEYLSSAGLRVILSTYKKLKAVGGETVISSPNETVMQVLKLTGFSDIIQIK